MKTRKLFILFAIILAITSTNIAQSKVQLIDALVKTHHEYGQFSGTILVSENGKIIYEKGFGMANREWQIPNKSDTKFRIGSVTKQFTAAMILQLVEEGKMKLDGKITDYLPNYRKDTGSKITIHQLLNHTSGIPSYTDLPGFDEKYSRDPFEIKDFVKKFASGDLQFEPGSNWNYNNSGYFILGAIIEKLDGKTYAESLQKRILDKIGMKDTGYDTHDVILKNRASGYQKSLDGYENATYIDTIYGYAAGAMYSTVRDMHKWDQALYGNKILTETSKKLMFTPSKSYYGYGVFILDFPVGEKKLKIIQHSGGINGFSCDFARVVDQNHSIVILDNIGYGRHHGEITKSIIKILNGQAIKPPKQSGREVLLNIARRNGFADAAIEALRLKALNESRYYFFEDEFNELGYHLLGKNQTKDAIEVFKLNVTIFPTKSNPYDSLGEAYLKDGQKELALINYKKSVELDSNNSNAVRIINRLEGKETKDNAAFLAKLLDIYVGEYEIQAGFTLTVFKEGEKLMAKATGQSKEELKPSAKDEFKVPSIGATVTFEKNSDGKISGLILNQGGQKIKAKKVK